MKHAPLLELPAREAVKNAAAGILGYTIKMFQGFAHGAAGGFSRRGAGVGPDGQIPLPGRLENIFFFHQQQRAYKPQAPAKEGLVHAHAVHPAIAAQVHKKRLHQVVGIMPQGQMRCAILGAQLKKPLAPQPRAAKTRRTAQVFG